MVKSAREKLETLGIAKEDIFWEQFGQNTKWRIFIQLGIGYV
jgi:hypothetical protein